MFVIVLVRGNNKYCWDGFFNDANPTERPAVQYKNPPHTILKLVKAFYSGQFDEIYIGNIVL